MKTFLEFLTESDPKPRCEKNHLGHPVIPSREQFYNYFRTMQANHIMDQVATTHSRWAEAIKQKEEAAEALNKDKKDLEAAEKARMAAAQLRSISTELAAAKTVLGQKRRTGKKIQSKHIKKAKATGKDIEKVLGGVLGGSKFSKMIAKHVTNAALGLGKTKTRPELNNYE